MEGAWFDDKLVKLSRERIDKTDYFGEVNVETPPVPGTTDQLDVNVAVTEKSTGNISVGAGFSQSEGVILSGSISQSNIFGSGKFVSLQINTGKINRAIGVSYTNPYFTVDGVSQGFDVYHRRSDPSKLDGANYVYKTVSTGGGLRFGLPLSETQSLSFGAAIDQTQSEIDYDQKDVNGELITPLQYRNFSDNFCGGKDVCSNISLPLTLGWVSDTKDSAINPTRGVYHRAALEVSPGGDLRYYKATYQQQRFYSVTQNMVLMLNGELGYANGLGGQDLPFFKNFFAGGPGSVRGYDTASLGPFENTTGDPVRLGGTQRAVFNAELSIPVPGFGNDKSLRFGPFFDAGKVSSGVSSANTYDGGGIRMSAGLAATWISPFGPLKFSFAQPLNDENSDKIQRFQFQMGQTF